MASKKTLQKKLLSSVFIIVTIIILSITALVTLFEKNRFQQTELKRMYYETSAIKKRIGHLMFGSNWRYLMITLINAKSSNPSILYFTLTDINGSILVSDDEKMIGKNHLDTVSLKDISRPLFERSHTEIMDKIPSRFFIYPSQLNTDIFEEEVLPRWEDKIINL